MMTEKPKSNNARRSGTLFTVWRYPFRLMYWAEKRCFEPTKAWLDRWALFDILDRVGKAVILVSLVVYVGDCKSREDQAVYQAWKVFADASGKPGDLGRSRAIKSLIKKKEDLRHLNLSGAILIDIDLRKQNLSDAKFRDAMLIRADLRRSILWQADLSGAYLYDADLRRAILFGTNLGGANVFEVNFSSARVSSKTWIEDLRNLPKPPRHFDYASWQVESVFDEDIGFNRFYIREKK